jgi:hypothetical protein
LRSWRGLGRASSSASVTPVGRYLWLGAILAASLAGLVIALWADCWDALPAAASLIGHAGRIARGGGGAPFAMLSPGVRGASSGALIGRAVPSGWILLGGCLLGVLVARFAVVPLVGWVRSSERNRLGGLGSAPARRPLGGGMAVFASGPLGGGMAVFASGPLGGGVTVFAAGPPGG